MLRCAVGKKFGDVDMGIEQHSYGSEYRLV